MLFCPGTVTFHAVWLKLTFPGGWLSESRLGDVSLSLPMLLTSAAQCLALSDSGQHVLMPRCPRESTAPRLELRWAAGVQRMQARRDRVQAEGSEASLPSCRRPAGDCGSMWHGCSHALQAPAGICKGFPSGIYCHRSTDKESWDPEREMRESGTPSPAAREDIWARSPQPAPAPCPSERPALSLVHLKWTAGSTAAMCILRIY